MNLSIMFKKLIPSKLKNNFNKIKAKYKAYNVYNYDVTRYLTYSNTINKNDSGLKLMGLIIQRYHSIEKGLTMPDMRYGFGKDVMTSLIVDCCLYYEKYDIKNKQFQHAVNVIAEYKHIHLKNNQPIDEAVLERINYLLYLMPNNNATEQILISKEHYFLHNSSSFDEFSNSRHSIRSFNGSVAIETIEKAVNLAQNAPSACNRQPIKIHIVEDKNKIKDLLNIQIGNRGFGHLADKLLVLTSDLSGYGGIRERNLPYIDAGIYIMNLLYSLHFYKIGACPLNWCVTPDADKKVIDIINIPNSEIVMILIACGDVSDNFKLTDSKRNGTDQVTKVI